VKSSSEYSNKTTGSIKRKKFLDQLNQHLNSQASSCFISLVELYVYITGLLVLCTWFGDLGQ
jgi:hypothetical protein